MLLFLLNFLANLALSAEHDRRRRLVFLSQFLGQILHGWHLNIHSLKVMDFNYTSGS